MVFLGRPPAYRRALLAGGSELWQGIDGIDEVMFASTIGRLLWRGLLQRGPAIVIPLGEQQLKRYPRLFWGLAPSREVVMTCHDKSRFARFAQRQGLGDLVPSAYGTSDTLRFPLIIKRSDMANGTGVAVVRSAAELAALSQQPPWAGHNLLLQEYVEGSRDLVTHCVARRGRIVWQASYEYLIDPANLVQRPDTIVGRRRVTLSADDRAVLERFLQALDYDGPATFDYRRRPDGRLVVFEINARFGGSLFRPDNIDDLRGALQTVIAHAAPFWRPQ